MAMIFYGLLIGYGGISLVKLLLASSYSRRSRKGQLPAVAEAQYTALQPILSGDPNLAHDLEANLKQTKAMRFIWLIDKSDAEGKKVAADLLAGASYQERVTVVLMDPVPQGINPKVYKLAQAVALVETRYTIILDDDTVIDFRFFDEMGKYQERQDEWIATGIPYNSSQRGWSRLVAAFVNSNSLLTYFSMAQVKQNKTINGMFYLLETSLLRKYGVYEAIQGSLCDDFEIARYLQRQQVQIIQSTVPCHVRTTVKTGGHYLQLMKRWLVFANIYLEKNLTLSLMALIALPAILPLSLVLVSFFCGPGALAWALGAMGIKAALTCVYRRHFFSVGEGLGSLVYEVLSDVLVALIYLYALLSPQRIIWRDKKIKVSQGNVFYE